MLRRLIDSLTSPSISLLFIAFMFFLPVLVMIHHKPITAFYGEWMAAMLGLMALMTLLKKDFSANFTIPKISLVFLALTGIVTLQSWLGMLNSAQLTLLVNSYLIWAFFLSVLGSHLRSMLGWENFSTSLAWFILFGGMVNACITAIQIAMRCDVSMPYFPILQSYGALAQENNSADYVRLAIASLIYLYIKDRLTFKLFLPCLVFLAITLSFSGSRSSFVYLGILTVFGIWQHLLFIKKSSVLTLSRKLFITSLWLLPPFISIQLLLYYFVPHDLLNLPTGQLVDGIKAQTTSLRWLIWKDSFNLGLQSPWIGIGVRKIQWQSFLLLDNPSISSSNTVIEHAHNLFLHLFTEMGIFAALLTLIGVASWTWNYKWNELSLESWWLISLLSIIGFHSLLEYPLWYTYFLGIASVLLGAGEESRLKIQSKAISMTFARLVMPLLVLWGLLSLNNMFIAFGKLDKWLLYFYTYALTESENNEFISDLNWVKEKSLLAPYAYLNLAIVTNLSNGNLQAKLEVVDKTMHFYPQEVVAVRMAALLKSQGNHTDAVKIAKRSLVAYPNNFENIVASDIPVNLRIGLLDVISEGKSELRKNPAYR